jgi:hypothetical protein
VAKNEEVEDEGEDEGEDDVVKIRSRSTYEFHDLADLAREGQQEESSFLLLVVSFVITLDIKAMQYSRSLSIEAPAMTALINCLAANAIDAHRPGRVDPSQLTPVRERVPVNGLSKVQRSARTGRDVGMPKMWQVHGEGARDREDESLSDEDAEPIWHVREPALPKWTPDKARARCRAGRCTKEFSIAVRRHHCRYCGEIFCNQCTSQRLPLPQLGIKRAVRLCEECYKSVRALAAFYSDFEVRNDALGSRAERRGSAGSAVGAAVGVAVGTTIGSKIRGHDRSATSSISSVTSAAEILREEFGDTSVGNGAQASSVGNGAQASSAWGSGDFGSSDFGRRQMHSVVEGEGSMGISRASDLFSIGFMGEEAGALGVGAAFVAVKMQPNSDANACSSASCHTKFTIIVRRHHCRACGRIFCQSCSNFWVSVCKSGAAQKAKQRVCTGCYKALLLVNPSAAAAGTRKGGGGGVR